MVGTARCAVRAAYQRRNVGRAAREERPEGSVPPAVTRAGTSQRDVPNFPMAHLPWLLLAVVGLFGHFAVANAAELQLSLESGLYSNAFKLSFTGAAVVRYTTNGAPPESSDPIAPSNSLGITTTTSLRCAAFDVGGSRISPVVSRTFIFPNDVLNQTGAGFPPTWGTNQDKAVPADYEVDPEIVRDPAYRDDLLKGLTNIPSLAIVMDAADLFDPARGIYANPMKSGDEWERSAAISYFNAPSG